MSCSMSSCLVQSSIHLLAQRYVPQTIILNGTNRQVKEQHELERGEDNGNSFLGPWQFTSSFKSYLSHSSHTCSGQMVDLRLKEVISVSHLFTDVGSN
jgi:hypothetical protein